MIDFPGISMFVLLLFSAAMLPALTVTKLKKKQQWVSLFAYATVTNVLTKNFIPMFFVMNIDYGNYSTQTKEWLEVLAASVLFPLVFSELPSLDTGIPVAIETPLPLGLRLVLSFIVLIAFESLFYLAVKSSLMREISNKELIWIIFQTNLGTILFLVTFVVFLFLLPPLLSLSFGFFVFVLIWRHFFLVIGSNQEAD